MMKRRASGFYAGQKILITGGTEFLAMTLIEKLLRCCPDLDTMYILLREKGAKSVQERWEDICNSQMFDKSRGEKPEIFSKVKLIKEELTNGGLGIQITDQEELVENVTVAFHITSDVQNSDDFSTVLLSGVKETKFLCDFLKDFKHLKSLIYLSPTFRESTENFYETDEDVVSPTSDWKALLKLQKAQPEIMHYMKEKFIHGHRNASSWSRAMSEEVVKEYSAHYPAAIVRPVLVSSTSAEESKRMQMKVSFTSRTTSYTSTGHEAATHFVVVCRADTETFIDDAPFDNYQIEQRKRANQLKSESRVRDVVYATVILASFSLILKYTLL